MTAMRAPTEDHLARILPLCATIAERLGSAALEVQRTTPQIIGVRLHEWKVILGDLPDRGRLKQRLQIAGHPPDSGVRAVSEVAFVGADLPDWCTCLNDMVAALPVHSAAEDRLLGRCGHHSIAFCHLLAPFACGGLERLSAQLPGAARARLSENALSDLGLILLRSLSELAWPALMDHFSSRRAEFDCGRNYEVFVSRMRSGGMLPFLREYPMLSRLLAQTLKQWLAYAMAFAIRLDADAEVLLAEWKVLGPVSSLATPDGWLRDGSQTVLFVRFEPGIEERTLVYKPRVSECDLAFSRLLKHLNAALEEERFGVTDVLDRAGYGWAVRIPHLACKSREDARTYYERLGSLAALQYLLGTTDSHFENLIACGRAPVMIDGETAFGMESWGQPGGDDWPRTGDLIQDTVLRSGLLPVWWTGKNGRVYDVSAMATDAPQETGYFESILKDPNTNDMRLERTPKRITAPLMNLPFLGDEPAKCQEYVEEFVKGFRRFYRTIEGKRRLLADQLSGLESLRVRAVVRPSYIYDFIRYHLRQPKALYCGVNWSIQTERLARLFLAQPSAERAAKLWPIFESERVALEGFEVPRFHVRLGGRDLLSPDGTVLVQGFLARSPLEYVTARLGGIGEDDLRLQEDVIRAAIQARYADSAN